MFGEAEADPRLPHQKRGLVPRVLTLILALTLTLTPTP